MAEEQRRDNLRHEALSEMIGEISVEPYIVVIQDYAKGIELG